MVIEQTEAFISIDVNTSSYVGSDSLEQTIYVTNMEAAAIIPRQLRLRNLGGIVVIDFIDMREKKHRVAVLAKLREELARDPAQTQVDGFTFLGLVQLSRRRTRESLVQVMCARCDHCSGTGMMKKPKQFAWKYCEPWRPRALVQTILKALKTATTSYRETHQLLSDCSTRRPNSTKLLLHSCRMK